MSNMRAPLGLMAKILTNYRQAFLERYRVESLLTDDDLCDLVYAAPIEGKDGVALREYVLSGMAISQRIKEPRRRGVRSAPGCTP